MAESIPTEGSGKTSGVTIVTREVAALAFWLYIVIKLFVFDVDVYFVDLVFPAAKPILNYKFFVFTGIACAIVLLCNRYLWFRKNVAYIAIYPIIIFIWRPAKILYKRWWGFIFIPTLYSLIESFKINALWILAVSLSIFAILIRFHEFITYTAIGTLFIFLVIFYVRQFKKAFQAPSLFRRIANFIKESWSVIEEKSIIDNIQKYKSISPDDKDYGSKKQSTLLSTTIIAILFHYFASKLKKAQDNRLMDIYVIGLLLKTFTVTVFIFGFIYYAIYSVDHAAFSNVSDYTLVSFMYFSFNTFSHTSLSHMNVISNIANLLTSTELMASWLFLIILVFMFTSTLRERSVEDINDLVFMLKQKASRVEEIIVVEFRLNLIEAKKEVSGQNEVMAKLLDYLQ